MKIKELISELQKYDEDTDIYVYDYEDATHCWDIEVRKQIEVYMCDGWGKAIGSTICNCVEEAKEHASVNKWYNAKFKKIVTIFYDF
jgi:hypothetical protein